MQEQNQNDLIDPIGKDDTIDDPKNNSDVDISSKLKTEVDGNV